MQTTLGDVVVNVFPGPPLMGHEEIVIPMLLYRSAEGEDAAQLGGFWRSLNPAFRPNDLSNTAAVGYTSGLHPARVNLERMFIGRHPDEWHGVREIGDALDSLGSEYAFFLEASASPLEDAFVHRCRFIARDRLHDFRPRADLGAATRQTATARNALSAFLRAHQDDPDCERLYGDYLQSQAFRSRFGDDENFFVRYVIWLEGNGVIRAWTRITYVPK